MVVFPEPCSPTIMMTVGGTELNFEPLALLAEHGGELVVDDLDELLSRGDGAELGDPDGFLFDAFEELAGQLEVDIGLEQDATHLPEAFLDVGLGQYATTAQPRERRFKFLGQLVEHRLGKILCLGPRFKASGLAIGLWLLYLAVGCQAIILCERSERRIYFHQSEPSHATKTLDPPAAVAARG